MNTNKVSGSIMSILLKSFSKAVMLIILICGTGTAYPQYWSSLAGGMNGYVYATAVYNGELIAAGQFSSADGVAVSNIARWNGFSWASLGTGLNNRVDALTVYNGKLYAGGDFSVAGEVAANYIASWNGTAWSNLPGGVDSTVVALAVYGNNLIAGGDFTHANGAPANYIAKYNDASGWSALGSGMGGSQGQVAALTLHAGALYAGGSFTTAGGSNSNHIAKWDGTSWSPLGNGINGTVYSLAGNNGTLVAGGLFSSAGSVPANNIASWNGAAWSPLGTGTAGNLYQYVLSLAVYNGNLYAGGLFTTAGGVTVNGIARWNGISWSDLNGGVWNPGPLAYGVYTMSVYGGELIAGGIFSDAGLVTDVGAIAARNEPTVPATINLQNETVSSGLNLCYNATQTITVAGSGTSFVVQSGGLATMIAGQNILYLPGTKVSSGGYMHGSITTTGQYCGTPAPPIYSVVSGMAENPLSSKESLFKVYPNPSNGIFFLELNKNQVSSIVYVDVISIRGDRVLSFILHNELKHLFSLSDSPAGVYFIRMVSDTWAETGKIIKQD